MEAGTENVTSKANDHEADESVYEIRDVSEFVFKRVLSSSHQNKSIFLEGSLGSKPETLILLLEKEPFQEEHLKTLFSAEKTHEKVFQNDIYSYFRYFPAAACNGIKVTSIYPATEKHVQKYLYQPIHIINETPELYKTVTLPHFQAESFSLQWVYNILEHKSESERILFEDSDPETGFVLLPDLKWDGKSLESLYILALAMKRGILSLRDLTEKEIPLLKNIYNKALKVIEETYSIPPSRLQAYLHYQPSFYHLHVHFRFNTSTECSTPRCHLLSTVINNITLMPEYYKLATLPFSVKQSDSLFAKYESLGLVKRVTE